MSLQRNVTSIKSSQAFRWTVGVGVGAMAALGLVLMFLLTQATGNRELYERTKRELARKDWRFMQNYADAKTPIVEEIIARAS